MRFLSTRPTEAVKPELHDLKESTTFSNPVDQTDVPVFDFDKNAEKRLLRKLDLRIIPILWLIFMLAFLDRTNV